MDREAVDRPDVDREREDVPDFDFDPADLPRADLVLPDFAEALRVRDLEAVVEPLRPDPAFLPPPSCLLTVAQARRSAS
ncbi:MAG TPA: hypothetical protein VG269_09705 [Tepidisphaeraceae bacterium]|nr:hypothetical protein [Tepidisphaeraceae bacterium]